MATHAVHHATCLDLTDAALTVLHIVKSNGLWKSRRPYAAIRSEHLAFRTRLLAATDWRELATIASEYDIFIQTPYTL